MTRTGTCATIPPLPRILYAALFLLFLLHQDFWLWNDSGLLLGLPIGLTYQVVYCLVVAVLMALLVRYAWPTHLDSEDDAGRSARAHEPG